MDGPEKSPDKVRAPRSYMMAWSLLALVLLSVVATVVVGMGLYSVTEVHPQFNTR